MEIYKDKSRGISERVQDLLQKMTIEEKAYQVTSVWAYAITDKAFQFDPVLMKEKYPYGLGQITRLGGSTPNLAKNLPKICNEIQKYFIENTRLGIPVMFHEESCSGAMFEGTTNFPQAIGVAASFNTDLCEKMASIIGKELRTIGANQTLAPLLDVSREPRWGRTEETFGEDPYLVSQMGMAYIRGIQKNNVLATGKHFVAYGAAEKGFNWAPAQVPVRTMKEVYLAPFEAAIKEAKLGSIMPAYQENDGEPCHSSKSLLKNTLRDDWGFDGLVVTDYAGLDLLYSFHKLFPSYEAVCTKAVEYEIDMELPTDSIYGQVLVNEFKKGAIDEKALNKIVTRVLRVKFELGLFDNPYIDENTSSLRTSESIELSEKLAEESIVLLKNQRDILPLPSKTKKIAIIGPNGDSVRNQLGDYAYKAHIETLIASFQTHNSELMFGQKTDTMQGNVSLLEDMLKTIQGTSIKEACSLYSEVLYAQGCSIFERDEKLLEQAIQTAAQSDIVIAVLGDQAGLTDTASSGESRDRQTLDLLPAQKELLTALKKTGKPIILVLIMGRPLADPEAIDMADAVLCCWFPGENGGKAIANILFGKSNPSGKLPITFPRSVGQLPIYYGHKPSGGAERLWGGYVDGSHQELFTFGYGMSYTTFKISDFSFNKSEINPGDILEVKCSVKNTGNIRGSEVVQLYFRNNAPGVTRPSKELKGFAKVLLDPNEQKEVLFQVPIDILGFYDENMDFSLKKGIIDVMIGTDAQTIHHHQSVTIIKDQKLPVKSFTTKVSIS